MAKIRVYELARDLNMTNKILIDKIRDMDVTIKSHMSSLDQSTVDQIKADLYGQKTEEVIETRIKPTVIRRRKTKVELDKISEPETGLEAETLEVEGKSPAETTPEEEIQAAAAEKAAEKITAKVTVVEDFSKEKAPLDTKEPVPTEAISEVLETPEQPSAPTEIKAKKRVK